MLAAHYSLWPLHQGEPATRQKSVFTNLEKNSDSCEMDTLSCDSPKRAISSTDNVKPIKMFHQEQLWSHFLTEGVFIAWGYGVQ